MTTRGRSSRAVLLSIKTRFVRSIMDGSKTHELRRKVPRDATGMRVIIYSSGVDRAITAHAEVAQVVVGTPDAIWKDYASVLGVTHDEYRDYFAGSAVAYALRLEKVTPRQRPVTLEQLRSDYGLEPPQSWRYLPEDSYKKLAQSIV